VGFTLGVKSRQGPPLLNGPAAAAQLQIYLPVVITQLLLSYLPRPNVSLVTDLPDYWLDASVCVCKRYTARPVPTVWYVSSADAHGIV
jgi:hypothetical protein